MRELLVSLYRVKMKKAILSYLAGCTLTRPLLTGLLCVGLAACGGGGNSQSESSFNDNNNSSPPGLFLVAGNAGGHGGVDGAGAAARFRFPSAIATDAAGNFYVVDKSNSTVRKITPEGVVTTLAGTAGVYGRADGIGAVAKFNYPSDITADAAGNIYVSDTSNHTIRKITPAGVVTTFAGTPGLNGSADGNGAAAQFNTPTGIAIDRAGDLYIADQGNYTIRKITAAGVVTTLAGTPGQQKCSGTGRLSPCPSNGDGNGADARFSSPGDMAIDASGNLHLLDQGAIRKVTPEGVVTTLPSTGSYLGITIDAAGNYITVDDSTIQRITPTGVATILAGTTGAIGSADGNGATAQFNYPSDVILDIAGNVYVVDTNNHTVRKITAAGVVTTLAGAAGVTEEDNALQGTADGTAEEARFNTPTGIATDTAGNTYVCDTYNHTIRKITPAGVVTTLAGSAGVSGNADGSGVDARFDNPRGIAIDVGGNLYVADTGNSTIRRVTPAGMVTTVTSSAQFISPWGIASDTAGNLYVADTLSQTIRKRSPTGEVTTMAGSAGFVGSADGIGATARFNYPSDITTDAAGNLYVVDTYNHTIRKITTAGIVTTLAGAAGIAGSIDGNGGTARFNNPRGITSDKAGNLYVADTDNSTIRKITLEGTVSTVAGNPQQYGIQLGDLPGSLSYPAKITMINANALLFTSGNSVLRLTLP